MTSSPSSETIWLPARSSSRSRSRTPPSEWFLSAEERADAAPTGRRDEPRPAWTEGNHVEPLVHGATYFARLTGCLAGLDPGDQVLLTDWRGDDDELLRPGGPRLGEVLSGLARRGIEVRGLLWRSHPKLFGFNEAEASELARVVTDAGGVLLLDARVRRGGSHHQKLVALLHPARHGDDVAFVGGIDLCHGRRDDRDHAGDPQAERLDPAYGAQPPWHDIQAEVRGPAVADLVETFRERWNDRTPLERRGFRLGRIKARATEEPVAPDPLPPLESEHAATGTHAVQVLRTYPVKRPPYPFAPKGERSIARMYSKALARARSLIYVEDQYFWSEEIATLFEAALRRAPDLRIVAVVPRHPDRNGRISGPATRLGQLAMMDRLAKAGGDRFTIYDLENEHGDSIYVHAKCVVIDDVFAMVGSDNLNRRSWTHDSELSVAVLDEELDEREPRDPAGSGRRCAEVRSRPPAPPLAGAPRCGLGRGARRRARGFRAMAGAGGCARGVAHERGARSEAPRPDPAPSAAAGPRLAAGLGVAALSDGRGPRRTPSRAPSGSPLLTDGAGASGAERREIRDPDLRGAASTPGGEVAPHGLVLPAQRPRVVAGKDRRAPDGLADASLAVGARLPIPALGPGSSEPQSLLALPIHLHRQVHPALPSSEEALRDEPPTRARVRRNGPALWGSRGLPLANRGNRPAMDRATSTDGTLVPLQPHGRQIESASRGILDAPRDGLADRIATREEDHRPATVAVMVAILGYLVVTGLIVGLGLLLTHVLLSSGVGRWDEGVNE